MVRGRVWCVPLAGNLFAENAYILVGENSSFQAISTPRTLYVSDVGHSNSQRAGALSQRANPEKSRGVHQNGVLQQRNSCDMVSVQSVHVLEVIVLIMT